MKNIFKSYKSYSEFFNIFFHCALKKNVKIFKCDIKLLRTDRFDLDSQPKKKNLQKPQII